VEFSPSYASLLVYTFIMLPNLQRVKRKIEAIILKTWLLYAI